MRSHKLSEDILVSWLEDKRERGVISRKAVSFCRRGNDHTPSAEMKEVEIPYAVLSSD